MTFYIKPPRGTLHLHIVEKCVQERLKCYKSLKNETLEVFGFQYLVEDSSLDRTGHYILRLGAVTSKSFRYDFINSELMLLETRLNSYDQQDVKQFLKRLLKHSREIYETIENDTLREIYRLFVRVSLFMVRNVYLDHIFKSEQCQGCEKFMIKVSFPVCLSMVAKREVQICSGYAKIPCHMWKKFLLCLFETYLKIILRIMTSCHPDIDDIRIKNVLEIVKDYNLQNNSLISSDKNTDLNITNIYEESNLFPLCMMSLLTKLQKSNRLAHNDRFEFSLYLKSIGMTLPSSLTFWQHFYSKQHSTCSSCTHSWQKSEKRYIYSIRHLYGLEGSRTDFPCKNCTYLQEKSVGPTESGGCPFKKFDEDSLRSILKSVFPVNPDAIEVIIFERNENPTTACRMFLETVYNTITKRTLTRNVIFSDPADYYLKLKGEISKGFE